MSKQSPSLLNRLLADPTARELAVAVAPATPRRRAAVVAHDGYLAADTWVKARPTVFASSLVGIALSAAGLWFRRKKGPEAVTLYSATLVASAAGAWISRPGQGGAVAPGAAPGSAHADRGAQLTAWLDARAKKLDQSEPGWESTALKRVMG